MAEGPGVSSVPTVTVGRPACPQKQMQQIMAHCFLAVKSKLECKLGYFDLIGCDFLIDENFKVPLGHPRAVGPGRQVQGAGASMPSVTTRQALGWTLQSNLPKPRGVGMAVGGSIRCRSPCSGAASKARSLESQPLGQIWGVRPPAPGHLAYQGRGPQAPAGQVAGGAGC